MENEKAIVLRVKYDSKRVPVNKLLDAIGEQIRTIDSSLSQQGYVGGEVLEWTLQRDLT